MPISVNSVNMHGSRSCSIFLWSNHSGISGRLIPVYYPGTIGIIYSPHHLHPLSLCIANFLINFHWECSIRARDNALREKFWYVILFYSNGLPFGDWLQWSQAPNWLLCTSGCKSLNLLNDFFKEGTTPFLSSQWWNETTRMIAKNVMLTYHY